MGKLCISWEYLWAWLKSDMPSALRQETISLLRDDLSRLGAASAAVQFEILEHAPVQIVKHFAHLLDAEVAWMLLPEEIEPPAPPEDRPPRPVTNEFIAECVHRAFKAAVTARR
jgi:hypothetical protein